MHLYSYIRLSDILLRSKHNRIIIEDGRRLWIHCLPFGILCCYMKTSGQKKPNIFLILYVYICSLEILGSHSYDHRIGRCSRKISCLKVSILSACSIRLKATSKYNSLLFKIYEEKSLEAFGNKHQDSTILKAGAFLYFPREGRWDCHTCCYQRGRHNSWWAFPSSQIFKASSQYMLFIYFQVEHLAPIYRKTRNTFWIAWVIHTNKILIIC